MARRAWALTIAVLFVLAGCSDDDSGGAARRTSSTTNTTSDVAETAPPPTGATGATGASADLCAGLQGVNLLISGEGPSREQLQDLRDQAPELLRDDLEVIIANLDDFDPGDPTVFNAFATINVYLVTDCAQVGTDSTVLPIPTQPTG